MSDSGLISGAAELIQRRDRKRWFPGGTRVRITRARLHGIRNRFARKNGWETMRTHKAASCLVIMAALLAGCSDDDKEGDSTATVEFKVTGDSPASVYIPGIKYNGGDSSGSVTKWDVDLDSAKTPWSKKFKVKPGRSLSLQTGSVNPKTEIGCQIFVNGKLVDEDTKKNKPNSTLVAQCHSQVPR